MNKHSPHYGKATLNTTKKLFKKPFVSISTIKRLAPIVLLCLCAQGWSQTPTPAQIAQFKSLSPAQQEAIAKSAGIDIGSMRKKDSGTQPVLTEPVPEQSPQEALPERKAKKSPYLQPHKGLPIFGLDLFDGDPGSLNQPYNVPVPADYVLGPGDSIVVQLYGKENVALPLTINREGQIQFPAIGPVTIAGMTFTEAQQLIDTVVTERKVGVKASTTMSELRTIRVFVLGEVKQPGSFTVGSLATMTNAIFASGGITSVGSLRKVQLKRAGKLITELDLYSLLLSGNTAHDSRLLPGDVIFVPPVGTTVEVSGSINRPARYELSKNSQLTSLIKMAGGLSNTSHASHIKVTRINKLGERSLFNVDYNTQKGKAFKLRNGDQISIGGTLDYINNQITIHGSAKRPGAYSWHNGIRFSDIISNVQEVLPATDIHIALLQRTIPKTGRIETHLFSPVNAWNSPKTLSDPELAEYDEIYLFNLTANRSSELSKVTDRLMQQARFTERAQVAHIDGSVKFPGAYPLTQTMNSQKLIELAGGLTESAFGSSGEITRYDISEEAQRVVMHISVDLQHSPKRLQAGDTLNIKQIPLWKQRESVDIRGEVMFPGTYAILPGETLIDVLNRAGGLTPHAHPVGAIFAREDLRKLEQQRLNELKSELEGDLAASITEATPGKLDIDQGQATALLKKLENTKALGRMVIDLPLILEEPSNHDFPLEDGDRLIIPRYKPSVTVIGEVQYPTSHFFNKKLSALEYINRSGGTKRHADKRRIYIVKANGQVIEPPRSKWFKSRSKGIAAGDTIVVPLNTEHVDKLEVWSKTSQIFYQVAIGAAAVASF